MWTGNTETAVTVVYQDGDGTMDINASLSKDTTPSLAGNLLTAGFNITSPTGSDIYHNGSGWCIGSC